MSSRRNRRGGGGGGAGGHGGGGEERWLLPYSDMITLLLGLFIVLFAMSTINAKQFDQVRRSLAQTFSGGQTLQESNGVLPGADGVLDPTSPSTGKVDSPVMMDVASKAEQQSNAKLDAETRKLQQLQQQLGLAKDVEVTRTEVGIQISIAGDALFASGSWELSSPGLRRELAGIVKELKAFGHPIRIEGHTDGAPYSGVFGGNHGLAANRAISVRMFFAEHGYSHALMHTVEFGPDKPKVKPKSPTDSVAANRRIEIIVLAPGVDDELRAPEPEVAKLAAGNPAPKATASDIAHAQVDARVDGELAATDVEDGLIRQIAETGR